MLPCKVLNTSGNLPGLQNLGSNFVFPDIQRVMRLILLLSPLLFHHSFVFLCVLKKLSILSFLIYRGTIKSYSSMAISIFRLT